MKLRHGFTIAATTILVATSGLAAVPVFADEANQPKSASLLADYNKAQDKVQSLNEQLEQKQEEISQAKKNLKTINDKIESNKKEIKKTEEELAARKETMTNQLKSLQKEQGVTGNVYLDFMLKSENFSDAVGRVSTIAQLNSANKKSLDNVNESKKKLDNLAADQKLEQAAAVATQDKLEEQQADLKEQAAKAFELSQSSESAYKAATADEAAAKAAAKAKAKTSVSTKKSSSTSSSVSAPSIGTSSTPDGNRVSGDSAGNAYAWGQCTWYVKSVAPWAGNHWGNGAQWGASARAEGFTVNNTPSVGSIIVFAGGEDVGGWRADYAYGHVAYVVAVNGSQVTIQQGGMGFSNPGGPNTATINGAGRTYIHR